MLTHVVFAGEAPKKNEVHGIDKVLLVLLSGAAAEIITFPLDTIKTRLQLRCQHTTIPATTDIWRQGWAFRGLSSGMLRHFLYTPLRVLIHEHLRIYSGAVEHDTPVHKKALVGGLAGAIAQVVASPLDLIRVRMQADGMLLNKGLQPRYSGTFDAFRKIILTEGFPRLWRGVVPNAYRAFLVNLGETACYHYAKRFFLQSEICHDRTDAKALAALSCDLAATSLSCPADVIKTRMMNQGGSSKEGKDGLYRNSFDCLIKTVKSEGMLALWKGFLPTFIRLGPWQFVFWVSYEKLHQVSGVRSS